MAAPSSSRQFTVTQVAGTNLMDRNNPLCLHLTPQEQVIGRADGVAAVVPVGTVSRRHAVVLMLDSTPHIKDLWSSSGTFVNFTRLKEDTPTPLKKGDLISLGRDVLFLVGVTEAEQELSPEDLDDGPPLVGLQEKKTIEAPVLGWPASAAETATTKTLIDLMSALESAHQESEVLELTMQELEREVGIERSIVLLREFADAPDDPVLTEQAEPKERLAAVAEHSKGGAISHRPSKDIITRALKTDGPVVAVDPPASTTDKDGATRQRSAICGTLRSDYGPLGFIYADQSAAAGPIAPAKAQYFDAVCRIVGARLLQLRMNHDLQVWEEAYEQLAQLTEVVLPQAAVEMESHLNRLEMIAEDVASEHNNPALSSLLRAESARSREGIQRYLRWLRCEEEIPIEWLPKPEQPAETAEMQTAGRAPRPTARLQTVQAPKTVATSSS